MSPSATTFPFFIPTFLFSFFLYLNTKKLVFFFIFLFFCHLIFSYILTFFELPLSCPSSLEDRVLGERTDIDPESHGQERPTRTYGGHYHED